MVLELLGRKVQSKNRSSEGDPRRSVQRKSNLKSDGFVVVRDKVVFCVRWAAFES
jgi:hypothetical protein